MLALAAVPLGVLAVEAPVPLPELLPGVQEDPTSGARTTASHPDDYGLQVVTSEGASETTKSRNQVAMCPEGKVAIAGGGSVSGNIAEVVLLASLRNGGGRGWGVNYQSSNEDPWAATAQAVCVTEGALDGLEAVSSPGASETTKSRNQVAMCPEGKVAIAGGGSVSGNIAEVVLLASLRNGGGHGWGVNYQSSNEDPWAATAQAVCISPVAAVEETPAPDPDPEPLADTGGGLAVLGLATIVGAALFGRRSPTIGFDAR